VKKKTSIRTTAAQKDATVVKGWGKVKNKRNRVWSTKRRGAFLNTLSSPEIGPASSQGREKGGVPGASQPKEGQTPSQRLAKKKTRTQEHPPKSNAERRRLNSKGEDPDRGEA